MTTLEKNMLQAIQTVKEILTKMLAQGLSDAKHFFVIKNVICDKHNLTEDQALAAIDMAFEII